MTEHLPVLHSLADPDHEPCPDCPVPEGVPWGAAMPYVMAHIEAQAAAIAALTARLDDIDPQQEAP